MIDEIHRAPELFATLRGIIDLVFKRAGKVELAVEIKRSSALVLSCGFHSARAGR